MMETEPAPGNDTTIPNGDIENATDQATLSGIQIEAASKIIEQVSAGTLTREAGINQLMVFLKMTREKSELVMGAVKTVKIPKPTEALKSQGGKNE